MSNTPGAVMPDVTVPGIREPGSTNISLLFQIIITFSFIPLKSDIPTVKKASSHSSSASSKSEIYLLISLNDPDNVT